MEMKRGQRHHTRQHEIIIGVAIEHEISGEDIQKIKRDDNVNE